MDRTNGARQLTRAFSDGLGLTPEEIGLIVTVAVSLTAAVIVLRVFDALASAWPHAAVRHDS